MFVPRARPQDAAQQSHPTACLFTEEQARVIMELSVLTTNHMLSHAGVHLMMGSSAAQVVPEIQDLWTVYLEGKYPGSSRSMNLKRQRLHV